MSTPTVNQAPIADAGADQSVSTGDSARVRVTLDGSGSSDPDGDPLTFTWTGSFGTLSGMIVNPVLDPGTHTVTLTVADGKGGADTDTVQISVSDGLPELRFPVLHRCERMSNPLCEAQTP